ncbi:MAG: phospholipase [Bacteroidetes bacterium]|nr:MAG: phospholipase [Bacteroidota bacterium]
MKFYTTNSVLLRVSLYLCVKLLMRYLCLFIASLVGQLACGQNPVTETKYPDFEKLTFTHKDGSIPYRLLKPKNYNPKQKYPLVVFFHGAGERGDDNEITLTHLAKLFLNEQSRQDFPCFVLVPQCPKGARWVEVDWGLDSHQQPKDISLNLGLAVKLMEDIEKNYKIDKDCIYATGLSMGGYAVWDLITRMPDKFAAAVPVCGGGDEAVAEKAKNLPIWAFHGALDKVVKPHRSQNMIKALEKAGGKPKYTEYPTTGHDSWKPAYLEPDLLKWLFSHKRK